MITLSLLPLLGMSVFSYLTGRRQIHERIRLSLVKMAQDTADKLDLLLGGKREEIHSMATTYPLIYQGINEKNRESLVLLLNNYCFNSDVYDLLIVLDKSGRIVGINTVDRNLVPFSEAKLSEIIGQDISRFPEEQGLFAASITGHNHHQDWYQSKLVQKIYQYGSVDRSHRYNIALGADPRPRTREVVGVLINILNWSHFQAILDNVEMDLADLDLRTGYSFMTAKDADTIIGHKYRSNRYSDTKEIRNGAQDFYHTSLTGNYGLRSLHNAIRGRERDF